MENNKVWSLTQNDPDARVLHGLFASKLTAHAEVRSLYRGNNIMFRVFNRRNGDMDIEVINNDYSMVIGHFEIQGHDLDDLR